MELIELENNLSNNLVTQSNRLIEARYTLTLYEQRIVLLLASMVEPDNDELKEYAINFNSLVKFLNLKNKNIHGQIKKILELLRSRTLTINKSEEDYLITGWISSAEYIKKDNIVKLSFSEELRPYLLELKNNFTKQRLGTLVQFKGTYTVRIYSLLKQYERIGKREFYLSDLKSILGIENKYPEYKNFKRRVLTATQNELSMKDDTGCYVSDINFKLETEKKGRKIDLLRFIIIKQSTKSPTLHLKEIESSLSSSILIQYEALGIKQNITLPYLKKDGEEALKRTLLIFEEDKKSGKIRSNEQGYLVTLLKSGAGVITEGERQDLENKKNKELEELKKRQQEQREKELLLLEKKYLKVRKDKYLSSLDDEAKNDLLETLREKYKENSFFLKMITDISSACIQDDLNAIVKNEEGYQEGKDKYLSENFKGLTKES